MTSKNHEPRRIINDKPLTLRDRDILKSRQNPRDFRLTDEEREEWEAIPPASPQEMEAIRKETPEQSAAISKQMVGEILSEMEPLSRRMRRREVSN